MKATAVVVWIALTAAAAGADPTLNFFGNTRADLPGPEILTSVYAENPSKSAESVHNSISFSAIAMPGAGGLQNPVFGFAYALCVPNFTLVQITQETATLVPGEVLSLSLLGIQFALSMQDLMAKPPFPLAFGVSVYRLADASTKGAPSGIARLVMDLGVSLTPGQMRLELLARNLFTAQLEGVTSPLDRSAEYSVFFGGKMILDIEFLLGATYSASFAPINPTLSVRFIRYFFSNSLRTGLELKAGTDLTSLPAIEIPLVQYGLSVSWLLADPISLPPEKSTNPFDYLRKGVLLLRNLSVNASALFIVNTQPGLQGLRPALSIGVTKFY